MMMGGKRHGREKPCCGKMRHRTLTCGRCGAPGLVMSPDSRMVMLSDSGLCTEGVEHSCESVTVQPAAAPAAGGEVDTRPAIPAVASGLLDAITADGRTTLPMAVRKVLDVKAGDRVRYIIEGDAVRIVAVRPIHRLFGVLPYDGPPVALADIDSAVADGGRA